MADDPEDLVPGMSRRLDGEIDALALDVRPVEHRPTTLEIGAAGLTARAGRGRQFVFAAL